MKLDEHPTVQDFRRREPALADSQEPLAAAWLRQLCLDCGADDAGLVDIDRAAIRDQRADILRVFPYAKTLVSFICRMNHEPIRSPARSVSNLEFHGTYDHANEIARKIVAALQQRGIRALNPSAGFPMEMDRFPGKIWVVAHKPVAVEAGLGGWVSTATSFIPSSAISSFSAPWSSMPRRHPTTHRSTTTPASSASCAWRPARWCDLAAGRFPVLELHDAQLSRVHERLRRLDRESRGEQRSLSYREKTTLAETASMWQSLSFGPNYKAAYCLAVCPAGEDVIGPFLTDPGAFLGRYPCPLTEKPETLYVIPGSDAEEHAIRRFPAKTVKARE